MTAPGGKSSGNGTKQQAGVARQQRGEERLRSIRDGVRAIVSEMRRVTWPSREEWISATVVVIGLVVVVAVWTVIISRIAEWALHTPQ